MTTPTEVAPELRASALRLARRLRVQRSATALSNNKVAILSHLARVGTSTPTTIASVERQQPQSLTRAFADLERDGLIARAARDGRGVHLSITEAGRAALDHDMKARDALLTVALSRYTPAEVELLRIAAALIDRLADEVEAPRDPDDRTLRR